jgi:hypothetical protein
MARLSIYVTDELKARMDQVGDRVNWSEVVRPAIQAAVATYEYRRSPSMPTVIERLKASKQKAEQQDMTEGKRAGRTWAEQEASYPELRRVAKISDEAFGFETLKKAVDPDNNLSDQEVWEEMFGKDSDLSEEYIEAFIDGAQELFHEIADKL